MVSCIGNDDELLYEWVGDHWLGELDRCGPCGLSTTGGSRHRKMNGSPQKKALKRAIEYCIHRCRDDDGLVTTT